MGRESGVKVMDWSTHISAMQSYLQGVVEDNAGAVMGLFGFFVAIAVVFWLIKKATKS